MEELTDDEQEQMCILCSEEYETGTLCEGRRCEEAMELFIEYREEEQLIEFVDNLMEI